MTEEKEKNYFQKLNAIDVSSRVEKKTSGKTELTYLSWAWAWAELCKEFPDAKYEIVKFEGGKPYLYDKELGYMVFTTMTINGETREMWLPVMDGANKAMKAEPYSYEVKGWNGAAPTKKEVQAATMFDINKTLMRCLVKNIAMFGLGLYIYAGEDLPESEDGGEKVVAKKKTATAAAEQKAPNATDKKKQYQTYMDCLAKVTSRELWEQVKGKKDAWVMWVKNNYAEEWSDQLNDKFLELAQKYQPMPNGTGEHEETASFKN